MIKSTSDDAATPFTTGAISSRPLNRITIVYTPTPLKSSTVATGMTTNTGHHCTMSISARRKMFAAASAITEKAQSTPIANRWRVVLPAAFRFCTNLLRVWLIDPMLAWLISEVLELPTGSLPYYCTKLTRHAVNNHTMCSCRQGRTPLYPILLFDSHFVPYCLPTDLPSIIVTLEETSMS